MLPSATRRVMCIAICPTAATAFVYLGLHLPEQGGPRQLCQRVRPPVSNRLLRFFGGRFLAVDRHDDTAR